MRNNLRTLVLGGALLVSASLAQAQTTLLDTLGNGKFVGNNASAGLVVGYDAGTALPNTPANPSSNITQSGYVVAPFTITDGNNYSLTSVAVEAAYQKAKDPNFATNGAGASLWGAIVATSSTTSGSLSGATPIGGFFQFTETGFTTAPNDNHNHIFTANLSGINLNAGQSYFLVFAPEAKFGTQPGDAPVLEFGTVNSYSASSLPVANSTTGPSATLAPLLSEKLGANSGDTLTDNTTYGAVRLVGTIVAGVPETSTIVTALLGLAPIGGLALRRRRRAN